MDPRAFAAAIERHLHPQPYTRRAAACPEGVHLLLTARCGLLGRYALALSSWDRELDGQAYLASRRQALRSALGALWMLREVGLYLVVCGPAQSWRPQVERLPADQTGLYAVILQAVHLFDLETGESHLNQSAWGPRTFGGVDAIAPIVEVAAMTARS